MAYEAMGSENCERKQRQEATFVVSNFFAIAPEKIANRAFEKFPELVIHLMKALPLSNIHSKLLMSIYKSLERLAKLTDVKQFLEQYEQAGGTAQLQDNTEGKDYKVEEAQANLIETIDQLYAFYI